MTLSGVLRTENGMGRFDLEQAAVSRSPGSERRCSRTSSSYYTRTADRLPTASRIDDDVRAARTDQADRNGHRSGRDRSVANRAHTDTLSTPLQFLKGVGPRKAADLKRAGLVTVEDLLYRLPFRYEDRSHMQPIASLRPGTKAAVLGEIKSANVAITRRRGFKIFHAVLADASGAIRCTWMNQAFLADILKPHLQVVVFGDVKLDSTGLHFMNPEYELVSEDLSSGAGPARIVPFYEKTGTVTPNMQRRIVRQALDQLPPDDSRSAARGSARRDLTWCRGAWRWRSRTSRRTRRRSTS